MRGAGLATVALANPERPICWTSLAKLTQELGNEVGRFLGAGDEKQPIGADAQPSGLQAVFLFGWPGTGLVE